MDLIASLFWSNYLDNSPLQKTDLRLDPRRRIVELAFELKRAVAADAAKEITMALNPDKSRKSMGIIASRERKKEFDAAVKEVMRQRKAAQNVQNAIRQQKKDIRPGLQRQPSGKLQLDTSSHRNKQQLRRATVAHGSSTDLEGLRKLRTEFRGSSTGGGNNNNSNNNAAKVRGEATATKVRHHRSSAGDITDSSSAQQGKGRADITERSPTLLGGRVVSNSRRNIFNASMSASDEVKKEVIQAMNKQEGGLSYDPISAKKKISSQPIISSSAQEATAPLVDNEPKKTSNGRNDSWTLSQDPQTTTDSNPFTAALCGIPGIRLEDLVPTRSMLTSPNSSNNGNGSLDDSGNGGGRHDGAVNQWKSKTLRMHPPQIDFELGNTSSSQEKTPSREAKSSTPSPPPQSTVEHDYNEKDCPRKKFLLLSSSRGGSRSGGTGNTSRGSIFSSRGSLSEGNSNPAMVPSIAAIEEEGKPRPKGGEGDEQSLQSNSSKFSLKSLRSRASRRSRHLSQIRMSIRNSLTGKSDGVPLVISKLYDGDDADSDIDINSSHRSVDPDKVRRHLLERKASSQSITSAYSNVTETSTSRNENTPAGWRYRLRKGGFRNQSMSAISVERDSRRSSNGSGWLDDESSSGNSFTEFYDNELHSGLMRSIISRTSSGRSLGLSLPTVAEGDQNGEKQVNNIEEQKEEETVDDIIASELIVSNGKLDASEKSDDTAESFYRHPAHEHPLLHVRPNQLFPESPGWRCDLCMQDTLDLNEWAYVSTGLNWVSCERCFAQNGEVLAN